MIGIITYRTAALLLCLMNDLYLKKELQLPAPSPKLIPSLAASKGLQGD